MTARLVIPLALIAFLLLFPLLGDFVTAFVEFSDAYVAANPPP